MQFFKVTAGLKWPKMWGGFHPEWLLYSSTRHTKLNLINASLILLLSQQDNLQITCNSQIKADLILNGGTPCP